MVAEEAADRLAALALESAHELDRADAVGSAVGEVAERARAGRRRQTTARRRSTRPASRRSPTSTSRWPWTSPTTKTGAAVSMATGSDSGAPARSRRGSSTRRSERRRRARASRRPRRGARGARARLRATRGSTGGRVIRSIFGCGLGETVSPSPTSSSWSFSPGAGPMNSIAMSVPRLLAREPDHLFRQVDDPHRLAHVEDVDLAAPADRAGLDDQLHCLGDRHEEARHLGMRHGHGPTARDLPPEDRHDGAGRAEHVAEAHRDEAGADVLAVAPRLDDPLRERLRLPHHRLRVRRLVGRDEHEPLRAVLDRDVRERRACRACCCGPPRAGSPPSSPRACRRPHGRRRPAGTCRRPGAASPGRARRRRPPPRRGSRAHERALARSRTAPARRGRGGRASPGRRGRSAGRARSRSSRRRR